MFTLHCELRHDNGTVEIITIGFRDNDGWHASFDHLIDVHCRDNTVELFPMHVTFLGDMWATYRDGEMYDCND